MRVLLALLLCALLVSGCSGKPAAPANAQPEPEAFQDIAVTDSTGAIRGLVVNEAIAPIAGATVKLTQVGTEQTTDAQGAFVFEGLEPGTYFLGVHKAGYLDVQASADVVAGVKEPHIVKVALVVDAANQPFTETLTWSAFLQCGAGVTMVGSLNPCLFTGSDNVHTFNFTGRIPDYVQTEAYWEGTQVLGNDLSMGYFDPATLASNWKGGVGPSPLIINATHDEISKAVGNDTQGLIVRVFPGTSQPLTVVLQQRYDIYETHFYGFTPRSGWTLGNDGVCGSPQDCG